MASNVAIEDLLPKAGMSTYRLVRMAANRAIELSDGKSPLVEKANVSTQKLTSIALKEIAEGKVVYKHAELPEEVEEESEEDASEE